MKSLSRLVAGFSLMCAASCANAYVTHLDTNAFAFDSSEPYAAMDFDNPGVTEITARASVYNMLYTDAVYFPGGGRTVSSLYEQDIQIAAKAGYAVTGYSLSTWFQSSVINQYPVAIPDPSYYLNNAGVASTDFTLSMVAKSIDGSTVYDSSSLSRLNLNGDTEEVVTLNSPVMSLQTPFSLHVDQNFLLKAYAGHTIRIVHSDGWNDYADEAFFMAEASGVAAQMVLTVYTAPLMAAVPEPGQYAMMLLGLAMVGALALRNKHRRPDF